MKIKNQYGEYFDYDAVCALMDTDIFDSLIARGGVWSEQSLYRLYCEEHLKKYGEEFAFDVRCPQV